MLSLDSQVLILLCSHLSLTNDEEPNPLTLREWNPLARKILASSLNRPEGLLGRSVEELKLELELSEAEALRLVRLLEPSEVLISQLSRLAS
jgi:hypothetical protein